MPQPQHLMHMRRIKRRAKSKEIIEIIITQIEYNLSRMNTMNRIRRVQGEFMCYLEQVDESERIWEYYLKMM